jgi:hypothetical protein
MEMMNELQSPWGLSFFGLTYDTAPKVRNAVFTQIHQIVFFGKGGYDWETIYNMPLWLRNFTFNQIKIHYDKEREEYESSQNNSSNQKTIINQDGKINSPDFLNSRPTKRKPIKYK